jgi:Tfp pilus assembly protein PilN
LDALGELYNRRVYLSTLFNALSQTSPKELSLETLSLSADNSIQLTGQASSYLVASKFARALETRGTQQTDFNAVSADAAKDADFTDVDLSGLSTQTNNRVSFTIKATASTRVINVKN